MKHLFTKIDIGDRKKHFSLFLNNITHTYIRIMLLNVGVSNKKKKKMLSPYEEMKDSNIYRDINDCCTPIWILLHFFYRRRLDDVTQ